MRMRLGGLAAALALVLGACGSGGTAQQAASPEDRSDGAALLTGLVSARDTLPPAPPTADALTVVLVHPSGAADPGLDAAAGALAQRPDVRVRIAVADGTGDETRSGFPVAVAGPSAADAVANAIGGDERVDLVVVGVADGHGIGTSSPEADAAARRDVPALVVGVEHAGPPDHAAATIQLLEVLDLELGRLLASGGVHRLAVPSCERGMLRGRLATPTAASAPIEVRSDCTATFTPGSSETDAFAAGYATLTALG